MKTIVNRSFTWYEVRNAITPTNGAYCKGSQYQFTKAEAAEFITELCAKKGSNYQPEDFQIVKVRTSEKTQ